MRKCDRAVTQKPVAFFLDLAPVLTDIMDEEDPPSDLSAHQVHNIPRYREVDKVM